MALSASFVLVLFTTLSPFSLAFVPACFRYRRDFRVESELENRQDTQLVIDTASLIAQGNISDCSDFRFRHKELDEWLEFWFESSCDQESTRIWVRADFGFADHNVMTIEMYYGCRFPGGGARIPPVEYGTETTSNFVFFAMSTTGCGGEWNDSSRINDDSRFVRLLSGARGDYRIGEFETHIHSTDSVLESSSSSWSENNGVVLMTCDKIHTHPLSELSITEPRFGGSFDWVEKYTDLETRIPRGTTAACCGTGGFDSHTHDLSGSVTSCSIVVQGDDVMGGGDVTTPTHSHVITPVSTNSGSNLPPYMPTIFARVISSTGGRNINDSILFLATDTPPLGFIVHPSYNDVYLRGSPFNGSRVAPRDGGGHHTATVLSNPSMAVLLGHAGGSGIVLSTEGHTHPGSSYGTANEPDPSLRERIEARPLWYGSSFSQIAVSSPYPDVVFDCNGIYWAESGVCSFRGTCPGTGACLCNFDPFYGDVWYGLSCELSATCGGLLYDEDLTCSGVGNCTQPDVCICDEYHLGPLCEVPIRCNGTLFNETDVVCAGHGVCRGSTDHCVCSTGFSGQFCEFAICFDILENETTVCSGETHGKCSGPDNCSCTALWQGPECTDEVTCYGNPFSELIACLHHGVCVGYDDCDCLQGYSGEECEMSGCFGHSSTSLDACNSGVCWGTDLCLCPDRYVGAECAEFIPEQLVVVTGSIVASELLVEIPYITSWLNIPETELNSSFKCSTRVVRDSSQVVGTQALCEWIIDGSDTSVLRAVLFRDDSVVFVGGVGSSSHKLVLTPMTSINIYERIRISLVVQLAALPVQDKPRSSSWVAGVIVPLLLLLLAFVAVVVVLAVGLILYRTKMKKFDDIVDVDIILAEQKAEQDATVPHLKISSKAFVIAWSDLQLLKLVGSGGSGCSVYKCLYRDSVAAIKMFKTSVLGGSADGFDEFETECEILSSLHFPFILSFYGATLRPPRIGIVMEYCENGDLANFLLSRRDISSEPYPLQEKLRMLREIASGIEYLHSKSGIHRDIKPENVLITRAEETRLTDFGVSKIIKKESLRTNTQRIGTAAFMAPEVYLGQSYNEKCDVFSFGVIVFAVLTDKPKPYGRNVPSIETRVAFDPNFRPRFEREEIFQKCPWVVPLMQQSWSSEPETRPSMTDILKEFGVQQQGVVESAAPRERIPLERPRESPELQATNLTQKKGKMDSFFEEAFARFDETMGSHADWEDFKTYVRGGLSANEKMGQAEIE